MKLKLAEGSFYPIVHAADEILNERGNPKFKTKIVTDKLIVNGKSYTTKTMHALPDQIKPEVVATPSKNNIVGFLHKTFSV